MITAEAISKRATADYAIGKAYRLIVLYGQVSQDDNSTQGQVTVALANSKLAQAQAIIALNDAFSAGMNS